MSYKLIVVTSHTTDLPAFQGIKVVPSGRFPSVGFDKDQLALWQRERRAALATTSFIIIILLSFSGAYFFKKT